MSVPVSAALIEQAARAYADSQGLHFGERITSAHLERGMEAVLTAIAPVLRAEGYERCKQDAAMAIGARATAEGVHPDDDLARFDDRASWFCHVALAVVAALTATQASSKGDADA